MEAFAIRNLSFAYPETEVDVLKNIDFSVIEGEFLTVCGASGSGKSTLLRLLKPSLAPHGRLSGEIRFHEIGINELSQRQECKKIGFVQQSPDNQIVTDKVWHELAFGLESLGLKNEEIRRRVAETASFFGIEQYFESDVTTLSGGQKQLLNLASVMAMQPEVLILDEPTSQLDPIAASDFIACLHRINKELGVTVIISEHRTEELLPISDRVLILDDGAVLSLDTPLHTGENLSSCDDRLFALLPSAMRIWRAVDTSSDCPVTVAQGREWLRSCVSTHDTYPLYPEIIPPCGDTVISLKNIWFRYKKDSPDVLKNLSFHVRKGEFTAILGGNGAGKSTLLSVVNGTLMPYSGKINTNKLRIATLPQNPQLLLSGNTVIDSLKEIDDSPERLNQVISLCELEELLERHPFDLSGGETQRAALAKLLLASPDIILLDEPTKGIDSGFKERFAAIINTLLSIGTTVVMVSHDVEFCAKYPHRCLMLFNGELVAEGSPREFFSTNSFYVTSSRRMSKGILENTVTTDDIIYCCTGEKPKILSGINNDFHYTEKPPENPEQKPKMPVWKKLTALIGCLSLIFGILVNIEIIKLSLPFWANCLLVAVPLVILMISLSELTHRPLDEVRSSRLSKRTIVSTVMILLAIPVTIFIGTTYLKDEKFLFISLLVLLECMLPFFLIFEGRKPQPRELVIIAVMCAIVIAGRSAFAPFPQIKPVLALVIISGVAFGTESGFMVGAVTMLVSNIYFGQGAWTPWQMFAAGIIGFIAGILFQKGFLRRSRGALCVFGFIVTVMIYGLIMNFSTIILTRVPITWESIISFYTQGLPFDLIHAFSTAVILFFAAEPMLAKLDRVKTKYGLY